ncbi:MAG: L-seryl-tRNA(Sec) selenium transferase, partial [Syntrophorhabdus sp.]
MPNNILRTIPKVDIILESLQWKALVHQFPESLAKAALRQELEAIRISIKNGKRSGIPPVEDIVRSVNSAMTALMKPGLRRVINATGTIIHTNLGRSLLAPSAINAIMNVAVGYSNLEYDVEKGVRGSRYDHCRSVIRKLTGAEDALVVNNNAAAVFLILNTFAERKQVIISRGELIEIGGSFRIPDVMKKSGAILKEVGTTNRTYIQDFERAITDETGLIMKAHTSNYRIRGFTHEPLSEELVSLGRTYNIPTYFDTGSGLLHDFSGLLHTGEPVVSQEVTKGFDIISFSGDKLLGGTQAGIIIGTARYVKFLKENPITRALRPDKFTLAGLEATLLLCLDEKSAALNIPTIRMINVDKEILVKRAKRLAANLRKKCPAARASVIDVSSEIGGGSFPDMVIPSAALAVEPVTMSVDGLEEKLRGCEVPVIGRIEKEKLVFDMRTVWPADEDVLIASIVSVLNNAP